MPPRRKPTSTRQKKADQQLKRAIKRGDVPQPEVKKKPLRGRKPRIGPTGERIGSADTSVIQSARKLQSAFIKLPPNYLEQTKQLASDLVLQRPIPDENAIFHNFVHANDSEVEALSCPRRPKWRFDMTKLEVEKNEEGVFKKYIAQTDRALDQWQNKADLATSHTDSSPTMPRSPSYFERNIEVWRQLWRVTEISQIILVLLDSRCPVLHYPPSLANYLTGRKVILVLTKVDISGTERVKAWVDYINKNYPNSRIVEVESYAEKQASTDHQGRKHYVPCIPEHFRAKLVRMIKEVHQELLEPPEKVANNPDRLKTWFPPVKREIDWDAVMQAKGSKVGVAVGGAAAPRPISPGETEQQESSNHHQEPNFLTIGLIGQPNVGKSSLLNALFGASKVRASKTAGKTKHFQTLYWTPDVRLVDCPGLVMPNYVPMEMQVLCGILPISRVSAVSACVHFVSQLLPLERIFKLVHPSSKAPPVEDKRTWRDDKKVLKVDESQKSPAWTAMDILTAYAEDKGWITAKAGRPDIHRAGNAILRTLAEGRIGWAFWPPDTPLEEATTADDHLGIWIPLSDHTDDISASDRESEEEDDIHETESPSFSAPAEEEDSEESEFGEEAQSSVSQVGVSGRFGALALSEGEETSE
uniref:Guanine nucleotide-binding protein-like 1 n=1 Tax=Psilocybe cubensis TaxID=181762 RepID=A0A8H8CQF2_PSICU